MKNVFSVDEFRDTVQMLNDILCIKPGDLIILGRDLRSRRGSFRIDDGKELTFIDSMSYALVISVNDAPMLFVFVNGLLGWVKGNDVHLMKL